MTDQELKDLKVGDLVRTITNHTYNGAVGPFSKGEIYEVHGHQMDERGPMVWSTCKVWERFPDSCSHDRAVRVTLRPEEIESVPIGAEGVPVAIDIHKEWAAAERKLLRLQLKRGSESLI